MTWDEVQGGRTPLEEAIQKQIAMEENNIVSALLQTREGRIFFALLIEESGFLKNGMRDSAADTAFAEGERSVGGRVFNVLWRCEEDRPLACMREYRQWLDQTTAAAVAKFNRQQKEAEE